MRPIRLAACLAALVAAILFSFASIPLHADDAAAKPDTRSLIKSVDAATSTIVIINQRNKLEHTYKIDDFVKLKVNGVPGKFSDLKAGQEVTDMIERDNDTLDAATISGY